VQEKATKYSYQRIRDLLKAEGLTYAQLSVLSEGAGLNYGKGYAATSIRTYMLEQRAQPDLLQFLVETILDSMQSRIAALQASLEAMRKELESVRAEFPQPVAE